MTTPSPIIALNNGVQIPTIGLGVWQSKRGQETYDAVRAALELGYRHIDTARIYGNEADVGRAVRDSRVPRQEVFVTTKLWNDDQGYDSALAAFDESLKRLDLGYIDLYLIHWPLPETRLESYKALETIAQSGRCRAIGVSNYTVAHLEELLQHTTIVPAVNQVEFHPFLYQRELLAYCQSKHVVVQAYSPLTHGKRLDHPVLAEVARHHHKTPAQVLIRWCIEHGLVALPKSVRRERIQENADVWNFHLSAEEMRQLDALDENLRTCWDPSKLP